MVQTDTLTRPGSGRLLSLDVFRGLTILFMIIVNNPGNGRFVYWPLEHARWNGLTPTDLVFPFFLFISGVSIVFALSGRKASGHGFPVLITTILRRGLLLIAIGIAVHSIPGYYELTHWSWTRFFSEMRYPGVLQRIGLVYMASSILYLTCSRQTLWILAFGFVVGYYLLMAFVPVPGIGPPTFDPAMNLESYLDRLLLSTHHLYRSTLFWDPEGVLSTLPAISTGLFGILTGMVLKDTGEALKKFSFMLRQGLMLLLMGILFSFLFPINKNLWSSSFVLVTAGLGNLLFSFFYYYIDLRKSTNWTKPFIVYGMNSILVYALAETLETVMGYIQLPGANGKKTGLFGYIYLHIFEPAFSSPYTSSMVWSVCYSFLFMPLLWYFYKRKIFLKV